MAAIILLPVSVHLNNKEYNKIICKCVSVIIAITLLVGFLKSIDFQMRYDAFSQTPVHIILLHSVDTYIRKLPLSEAL